MVSRYFFLTILFVFLFLSVSLALSSDLAIKDFFDKFKHVSLVIFAFFLFFWARSYRVDALSACGYLFFSFFTLFFTLINQPDVESLLVFFGYLILFLVWISTQSRIGAGWALNFFSEKVYMICWIHLILSVLYFFDANAYTLIKGQYSGYMGNPNAYAGVTGVLLVLILSQLQTQKRSMLINQLGLAGLLGFFLILAGSRAALLCAFIAFLGTDIKMKFKVGIVFLGFFLAFSVYFGSFLDNFIGHDALNRDLMEDTGRGEILEGYIYQIFERSLFFGTGLSESGGRIKTELAYVDLLLFSGIGALGFFLFVVMGLVHSFRALKAGNAFMFPVMIYVFVLSFFEGYLSNVMAMPTIIFYMFHGVSYFLSRGEVVSR